MGASGGYLQLPRLGCNPALQPLGPLRHVYVHSVGYDTVTSEAPRLLALVALLSLLEEKLRRIFRIARHCHQLLIFWRASRLANKPPSFPYFQLYPRAARFAATSRLTTVNTTAPRRKGSKQRSPSDRIQRITSANIDKGAMNL